MAASVLVAGVPTAALGDDTTTQVFPGITLSGLTLDLDGDGSAEVARLVDAPGPGFRVEVWDLESARWAVTAAADLISEAGPDGDEGLEESAALLAWRLDGRERLLAVTSLVDARGSFGASCCLQLHDIGWRGGDLAMSRMPIDLDEVRQVTALDLDADGTDELALVAPEVSEAISGRLAIHVWGGSGWGPVGEVELSAYPQFISGDEIDDRAAILMGPDPSGFISRLSMVGGTLDVEVGQLDVTMQQGGWLAAVESDRFIVTTPDGVHLVDWPFDEGPSTGATYRVEHPDVRTLGTGAEMLVLVREDAYAPAPRPPSVTILDAALRPLGRVHPRQTSIDAWEILRPDLNHGDLQFDILSHFGGLPGLVDGRHAAVAGGLLIQPDGAAGFDVREISSFIGMQPVGRAGPDDAWVAMGDRFVQSGSAYLYPVGFFAMEAGRFVVAELDTLLDPAPPSMDVRFGDGVEVDRHDGEVELVTAANGVTVEVGAPEGSLVLLVQNERLSNQEVTRSAPSVSFDLRPPGARSQDEDLPFERWIAVITPDGRSAMLHVHGTFVREDPLLRAKAATPFLGLRADVTGRAARWAEVTVNGSSVPLDDAGRFATQVDAPIWPVDVIVRARDPFGRESTTRLQVLGVFDYRGLPWGWIVGAGILAAGIRMFLRAPTRRDPSQPAWGDATLEEIDGD